MFQVGDGKAFYVVVNTCQDAKAIDETEGLTTYADASLECVADDAQEYTTAVQFQSKTMSQDPTTPTDYLETGSAATYFTNRIQTNLMPHFG